ncbi:hypothetical protein AB0P19_12880 [Microbacterium oleivorans]|uniref:hypothetical protein n=1 Tax=Microbacterium oleivorans TaxID=273677 RepID=UPI0033C73E2A
MGIVSRWLLLIAALVLLAISVVAIFVGRGGDGPLVALIVVAGVCLALGAVGVLPNTFAFGGNEFRFSESDVQTVDGILRYYDVPAESIAKVMSILDRADPDNSAVDEALASADRETSVIAKVQKVNGIQVERERTVPVGEFGGRGRPPIVDALLTMPDGSRSILEVISSASPTQVDQVIRRIERVRVNPEFANARVIVVAPDRSTADAVREPMAERGIEVASESDIESLLLG